MDKLKQQIHFCKANNTRIAYATRGSGSSLVKTANWLTHLEFDLASPVYRPWRGFFEGCHTHRDTATVLWSAGFSLDFISRIKPITHRVYRHDVAGFLGVLFKRAAQPGDMHIHRSRGGCRLMPPHLAE